VRGDWPYNVSNTLLLPFSIINPVEGPVSSPFGLRVNPVTKKEAFHYGIDIAAPKGTNILAVYEGTVKEVGRSVAYGNYIVISHPYEGETFYGHCSSNLKKAGQTVKQGEAIAKVGSTGWSTGNHLHFEVRRDSYVLPPDKFVHLK
jgi:murein DD-endopeptidase MepM/ murein hydrolase activator NlpD